MKKYKNIKVYLTDWMLLKAYATKSESTLAEVIRKVLDEKSR